MLTDRSHRTKRWLLPLVVVGVIGFVLLALSTGQPGNDRTSVDQPTRGDTHEPPSRPVREFPKAPRFTLKDYDSNDVSLSDFTGTPVVLNSWATWCPYCREELPDFADVADEFGGQVVVLAINRGESRQTARDFTFRLWTTTPMIFLLDPTDAFYEAIGGISMPETLFVDRGGRVRYHARGPVQKEEFRRQVELLIKER